MAKGQKFCQNPKCLQPSGPRACMCKACNTPFVFKDADCLTKKNKFNKAPKASRDVNWRELVKGDRIKVRGGTYFINSSGEFVPMGYRGKFVVDSLDGSGIRAWGIDKFTGFCHIWMGKDKVCQETNLHKTAHQLMKLKPLKVVENE